MATIVLDTPAQKRNSAIAREEISRRSWANTAASFQDAARLIFEYKHMKMEEERQDLAKLGAAAQIAGGWHNMPDVALAKVENLTGVQFPIDDVTGRRKIPEPLAAAVERMTLEEIQTNPESFKAYSGLTTKPPSATEERLKQAEFEAAKEIQRLKDQNAYNRKVKEGLDRMEAARIRASGKKGYENDPSGFYQNLRTGEGPLSFAEIENRDDFEQFRSLSWGAWTKLRDSKNDFLDRKLKEGEYSLQILQKRQAFQTLQNGIVTGPLKTFADTAIALSKDPKLKDSPLVAPFIAATQDYLKSMGYPVPPPEQGGWVDWLLGNKADYNKFRQSLPAAIAGNMVSDLQPPMSYEEFVPMMDKLIQAGYQLPDIQKQYPEYEGFISLYVENERQKTRQQRPGEIPLREVAPPGAR